MAVSVRDVAAVAAVSVGTVSNVLNRPDKVAPATAERVLAAIDSLWFRPQRRLARAAAVGWGRRLQHRPRLDLLIRQPPLSATSPGRLQRSARPRRG